MAVRPGLFERKALVEQIAPMNGGHVAGQARYFPTSRALRRLFDTQSLNQLIEKHGDAMRDFPFPSFRVAPTRNHAPASINQDRPVRRKTIV